MGRESFTRPKIFSDEELERLRTDVGSWMEGSAKRTSKAPRTVRKLDPKRAAAAAVAGGGTPQIADATSSGSRVRPTTVRHSPRRWMPRWSNQKLAVIVCAMVVSASGISAWSAIYVAGWDNRMLRGIAAIVPLPAVYAGAHTLRLADFFSAFDRIKQTWPALTTASARTAVIASFARSVALEQLAAELPLAIRSPDPSEPSPTELERAVHRALAQQPAAWERSRQRAIALRRAITEGQTSFAEAARRYSRHPSAAAGGDLGYRRPAEFSPEMFSALINSSPGTVEGPLRAPDGWWLVQAPEFIGATTTPEFRVRLMIIALPPDGQFRELLAQKIAGLNIKRLVP